MFRMRRIALGVERKHQEEIDQWAKRMSTISPLKRNYDSYKSAVDPIFRGQQFSWDRVAALYAATGLLALSYVKVGCTLPADNCVDWLARYIGEGPLADWLDRMGGLEQMTEID